MAFGEKLGINIIISYDKQISHKTLVFQNTKFHFDIAKNIDRVMIKHGQLVFNHIHKVE